MINKREVAKIKVHHRAIRPKREIALNGTVWRGIARVKAVGARIGTAVGSVATKACRDIASGKLRLLHSPVRRTIQ